MNLPTWKQTRTAMVDAIDHMLQEYCRMLRIGTAPDDLRDLGILLEALPSNPLRPDQDTADRKDGWRSRRRATR